MVVVVVLVVVGRRVVEVEVEAAAVVVVGRAVEVVGAGRARTRGLVEEVPETRPRGRRVVGAAAALGGATCSEGPSDGPGAVTSPSAPPPIAPSTTATNSIAHRRSTLNRTCAPASSRVP